LSKKSYLEQKFNHEQIFAMNKKSCLEQEINHERIICLNKNPVLKKKFNHERMLGMNGLLAQNGTYPLEQIKVKT
jgi:homoserine trans-succinylase